MGHVFRTFECGIGHRWKLLVERGEAPPAECPICEAIVAQIDPPHAPAHARSDTVGAPLIRSARGKAIQRFENVAFKPMNADDDRILPTNMRDNVREGETYAVPETASSNEIIKYMKDAQEQAQAQGRETSGGAAMAAMGGGWGAPSGMPPNLGGGIAHMRPAVDLQSKNAPRR